jgi:hypothetical protein
VSTTAPDARKHRKAFMAYVVGKAEDWHREHLGDLYRCWEEWNAAYFGGELVPPYVLLAEPSSPRALGDFSVVSCFGGQGQIRIRPSLVRGTHKRLRGGDRHAQGRRLFVRDIALHETAHLYCEEIIGKGEESYKGHGPVFAGECNRIGEALGLPPVRPAKARGGQKDLPSCAQWPHNVRPAGYYLGAVVEAGEGDGEGKGPDKGGKADPPDALAKLKADWGEATAEQQSEFVKWAGLATGPTSAGPVSTNGDNGDTVAKVDGWFRELALRYHPDRGGSDRDMQVLNDARDRLRAALGLAR